MSQKHKLPIRQSQASARAKAEIRHVPLATDAMPFARIEWSATEQARIAELLAKDPTEPTAELLKALRPPRDKT